MVNVYFQGAEKTMTQQFLDFLNDQLQQLKTDGLYKQERVIDSQQSALIEVNQQQVINLCANNYLGLANHPDLIQASSETLQHYGYGVASVRFICGTQTIHKQLEAAISNFLHMPDAMLYASCFDANGGLFETLLSEKDAVISDALNHASIIDGIRLCKAQRFRYANNDMHDLQRQLQQAQSARFRLIVTDGVFSMDGSVAKLADICQLADQYQAMVMVDDSHALGVMGEQGRGTPEFCGVMDDIDIITGTLGKALGGAAGGFTSADKLIVDWLRQRSRPYLFSNSLAPSIVGATLKVIELLQGSSQLRTTLHENSQYFRQAMTDVGFQLLPGQHPIIPVMLGDAALASQMADALLQQGVYVIGFSYPVVPHGQARIRTQMSAAHTKQQLDQAIDAFASVGRQFGVIA